MYILQEHDLLVDVTLFLWFKCKVHFSKITSDSLDGHKATYQDPFFIKVNMKIVNFQPKRPGETRVHVFRGIFALPVHHLRLGRTGSELSSYLLLLAASGEFKFKNVFISLLLSLAVVTNLSGHPPSHCAIQCGRTGSKCAF